MHNLPAGENSSFWSRPAATHTCSELRKGEQPKVIAVIRSQTQKTFSTGISHHQITRYPWKAYV